MDADLHLWVAGFLGNNVLLLMIVLLTAMLLCHPLQHSCLGLLREMLLVLELAERTGTGMDRRAADRLQRR